MVPKIFKNIKKQFNKVFKRKNRYEKLIDNDSEDKKDDDMLEIVALNLDSETEEMSKNEYHYVPEAWLSEVVANEDTVDGFADFDREVEPWEDPVIPDHAVDRVPKQIFKSFDHPTLGYVSLKINDMGLEIYTDDGSYNAWEEAMIMDSEDHMTRGWSMQFPIRRMNEVTGTGLIMDKLRLSAMSP